MDATVGRFAWLHWLLGRVCGAAPAEGRAEAVLHCWVRAKVENEFAGQLDGDMPAEEKQLLSDGDAVSVE